jgi:HD-GYP domain-containing protein (c-di-GMP phosphodiesterase class II)
MVRRAEIVAALSIATDLAMGQPLEFALRACILSVRLGEQLGFTTKELRETYYGALLRYIGCNAETSAVAALFGDEMELRRDLAATDRSSLLERTGVLLRAAHRAHAGAPLFSMIAGVMNVLANARRTGIPIIAGHCEVAERIAHRLGLGPGVAANLGQFYERWDGGGLPRGLKGEAIAPPVRVVALAQDLTLLAAAYSLDEALAVIQQRRGKAYDPRMVDCLMAHRNDVLSADHDEPSWDAVLALEPGQQAVLSDADLDEACRVMADFTDLKAPFTAGHSRAVAALATAAGHACGLPEADVAMLSRAALVHDLGDAAIPTMVWIKTHPLTEGEWERVRLHPYYTERILARPIALAGIRHIASLHHERLDSSGYHRAIGAAGLPPAARLLAAAEAYQTKLEARPHRPALTREAAATALQREIRAGRIDSEAGAAILAVAGHRVPPVRRQLVADLTARELDVLRLIARGQSTRQVAQSLGISAKTADNHIQHLYSKLEISTRAGATLFAIEHGLSAGPHDM